MANSALPGFQVVQTNTQAVQRRRVTVVSAGTKLRRGDAVIWGGASIAVATTTNVAVAGALMGGSYVNADSRRVEAPNIPATTYTGTTIFNPNANYGYIPEDGVVVTYLASAAGSALALTDIDLNLIMVLGTTTTKYSDHTLTATSKAVTATLPWRLIGFLDSPQSDPDAATAHCLVKVNAGYFEPALSASLGV